MRKDFNISNFGGEGNMKRAYIIFLSLLFVISVSSPILSNTGDIAEENMEEEDSAYLEDSEDTTTEAEVTAEDDSKLIEELSTPDANLFNVPSSLQTNVDFWKKIYSEFTTDQVVVHDKENLNIIYDVVNISNGENTGKNIKIMRSKVNSVRRKYIALLKSIHYKVKKGALLNSEEIEVYRKFDNIVNLNKYLIAAVISSGL